MFAHVLAAIDVSEVIGVCVLVISVLSWFVNVIQGNKPDGAPRANQKPKPKPKPPTGRSEIEALLQQLTGEQPKPQRREPPRPPKPQMPPERQRSKQKPTSTPQRTAAGKSTARPLSRGLEAPLPPAKLGDEVRSHHLANRVDAEVRQDITEPVNRDIQATVQHDLGDRIAPAKVTEKPVHPLVKVLRDRQGVRQAILLNEILQRPKSRRH